MNSMGNATRRIVVSGGIGVGKTTLASRLHELLPKSLLLLEYPEQNPFLADFYADMKRWAFHSRIAMLAMFAKRESDAAALTSESIATIVMDRCLSEGVVFARLQHAAGNMTGKEFETYLSLRDTLLSCAPPLDVVIHLSCDVTTALARVRTRARPFEAGVTTEYLARIATAYEGWIAELPATTRVMRCDTSSSVPLDHLVREILELT